MSKVRRRWRVAVRDRADQKNERVLIGALLAPAQATNHYLNVCLEPELDPPAALVVTALANSLLLDYLGRPFVGIHMSAGILNKLPWRIDTGPKLDDLQKKVLRLTCTRSELADLPAVVGARGIQPATDPRERGSLRAELDAEIARRYGLTALEWARILASFRLLDQDQPPLPGEPKSFITRDTALLRYFGLSGEAPPSDVVAFFGEAGADIAPLTGGTRSLADRVRAAEDTGAVAYLPSARGSGGGSDTSPDDESED